MSSIYKKSRDGYYYYQTYVYNPDTGKKNKRIYHTLGTKDKMEAQRKQVQLDKDHEDQKAKTELKWSFKNLFQSRKSIVIGICTIIIVLFLQNIFKSEPLNKHNQSNHLKESLQTDEDMTKITKQFKEVNITIEPEQTTAQIDTTLQLSKPVSILELSEILPSIPPHTIVRVDRLSGTFDQGKIYATVEQSTSIESMRLLCDKLKKDYNEFSNIIICLYANNTVGNELAKGIKSTLSTKEQSRAWLAMYSYNMVEGEYFDDDPGSYLGAY